LAIFLPPRVWARRRQPPTGKSAEHGGHVIRFGDRRSSLSRTSEVFECNL
jgi:hypothetical protein